MSAMRIDNATADDAQACAEIYAPYVVDTVITFELEVPGVGEMAERIRTAQRSHAWLVAHETDEVLGYAYGGRFAARPAYRWAAEVSIYLAPGVRRTGAGRALYTALFERLTARGYRRLFAGMTLPNEASEGLHLAMGFETVGTLREVGWKHGAWHDVRWMQRAIGRPADPPDEPR